MTGDGEPGWLRIRFVEGKEEKKRGEEEKKRERKGRGGGKRIPAMGRSSVRLPDRRRPRRRPPCTVAEKGTTGGGGDRWDGAAGMSEASGG